MHRFSLSLVACLLFSPALAAADTARPNFIVFLTDDQGWGDLGCYGHPELKTPHLDQFASEGLRLTQCYSACAVCSPSRSAILTGRTPYRNGVWRWIPSGSQVHLRTSEITIASLLKKHGYDTCHAGKWHLNGHFNSDQQPQPSDHGYDHWLATQNNAAPNHLNPINYVRNGTAAGKIEGPSAVIAVQEVIGWLKNRKDAGVPFFITVWTHEPHLPIESAEEFMAPYAHLEDEGLRQHHGNITQLDHAFGLLMKAVDEMGYQDNTLVIYTSDNGPEGNGKTGRTRGSTGGLRGRKRHSHEGGIRVPGLVRWPGHVEPGSESSEPVIGSDIFSTLLDVVGIPLPADRTIDGASMLPLFEGRPITRTEPLYWRNHLAPQQYRVALRIGDWKIIGSDRLEQFELYNIQQDPHETRDLSGDHPDRFRELKQALIEQDREVLEEGPDWWKNEQKPRARSGMLKQGKDTSGDFDVVLGTTVTKEGENYILSTAGEGLAMFTLEKPLEKTTRITTHYQSLVKTGKTRNAMIVLGATPTNDATVKIGTAIGLNQHSIFDGGWANLGRLTRVPAPGDPLQQWNITIVIRPGDRHVDVEINGRKMAVRLPRAAVPIRHLGFYNKQTVTSFAPLKIETVDQK
jgi:arylsulfatase A